MEHDVAMVPVIKQNEQINTERKTSERAKGAVWVGRISEGVYLATLSKLIKHVLQFTCYRCLAWMCDTSTAHTVPPVAVPWGSNKSPPKVTDLACTLGS